jgi:hypothetical protein
MKWLTWTNSSWRPKAFLLLTTILIICISANPELAPFIPVLDAFGLDVLLYLLAAQSSVVLGGMLLPLARHAYRRFARPAVRYASCVPGCAIGGCLWQVLWQMAQVGVAAVSLRPTIHSSRTP